MAEGNANVGPWHVAHTTNPVTYQLTDLAHMPHIGWLSGRLSALFDPIKYLQMATLNGLTPKSINQL